MTLHKLTPKKSVKTNMNNIKENQDSIKSPTNFAEIFYKNFVNIATTDEDPTTQEPKQCIENNHYIDDKLFASPTNIIEVFLTVGNLKK